MLYSSFSIQMYVSTCNNHNNNIKTENHFTHSLSMNFTKQITTNSRKKSNPKTQLRTNRDHPPYHKSILFPRMCYYAHQSRNWGDKRQGKLVWLVGKTDETIVMNLYGIHTCVDCEGNGPMQNNGRT